jgi:hypothetical protein
MFFKKPNAETNRLIYFWKYHSLGSVCTLTKQIILIFFQKIILFLKFEIIEFSMIYYYDIVTYI